MSSRHDIIAIEAIKILNINNKNPRNSFAIASNMALDGHKITEDDVIVVLQVLKNDGYVNEEGGLYSLTSFGKSYATELLEDARQNSNTISEETIISHIDMHLLPQIPFYGEFDMHRPVTDRVAIVNTIEDAENLVKKIAFYEVEDAALQWLIFNGFVINRHDIQQAGRTYRQLTDKGRVLKEHGSVKSYKKTEAEKTMDIELEKQYRKSEQQRNKYLFWITVCIAVSTVMQGAWNLLETIRNYYNQGAWLAINVIVPILSISFLMYISYIILKERPRNKRKI